MLGRGDVKPCADVGDEVAYGPALRLRPTGRIAIDVGEPLGPRVQVHRRRAQQSHEVSPDLSGQVASEGGGRCRRVAHAVCTGEVGCDLLSDQELVERVVDELSRGAETTWDRVNDADECAVRALAVEIKCHGEIGNEIRER